MIIGTLIVRRIISQVDGCRAFSSAVISDSGLYTSTSFVAMYIGITEAMIATAAMPLNTA